MVLVQGQVQMVLGVWLPVVLVQGQLQMVLGVWQPPAQEQGLKPVQALVQSSRQQALAQAPQT